MSDFSSMWIKNIYKAKTKAVLAYIKLNFIAIWSLCDCFFPV